MKFISQLYTNTKELLQNGIYVFLSNLLEKFTFFALFVLLARFYPAKTYGIIIATFAFSNILISFFEGGFNFYIQRLAATSEKDIPKYSSQLLTLRIYLTIPYLAISIFYFFWSEGTDIVVCSIIAVTIALFSFTNYFNSIFFGLKKYRATFVFLSISRFLLIATFFLFFYSHLRTEIVVLSFIISAVVHLVLLVAYLNHSGIFIRIVKPKWMIIKPILKSSLPMGAGMIFVWIYDRVDTLVIQNFIGLEAVAFYAVAYSIYKAPQSLSNFLLTPLFSEYSSFYKTNKYISKNNFYNKALILVILAIAFSLPIYFFSAKIIVLLYKIKYLVSSPILMLLIFGLPGLLLNNLTGTTLNSSNNEKYVTISVFVIAVGNIIANFILIYLYRSIYFAALVSIISEYLVFIIQLYFLYKLKVFSNNEGGL